MQVESTSSMLASMLLPSRPTLMSLRLSHLLNIVTVLVLVFEINGIARVMAEADSFHSSSHTLSSSSSSHKSSHKSYQKQSVRHRRSSSSSSNTLISLQRQQQQQYPLMTSSQLAKSNFALGLNETCPPCFNCMLTDYKCINTGKCSPANGRCTCPPGFGGDNCGKALCGALSDPADKRPVKPDGSTECECSAGWAGVNCNMCVQDDVCDRIVNPDGVPGINGTCYRDMIPVKQIYSDCSVENKYLRIVLGDNKARTSINCDRSQRTCNFQLWVNAVENFHCSLSDCETEFNAQIHVNQTITMCKTASCSCIKNTFLCDDRGTDISEILDAVAGPASMRCQQPGYDNGRYNCQFSEANIEKQLEMILGPSKSFELQCVSGQCLHYSELPGFIPPAKPSPYGTVFTVVGSVLLVCIILGSFGYRQLKLYKERQLYRAYNANFDSVDDELEKLMESGHHVPATLIFRDISYEIPVNSSPTTTRKRVLRGIHGIARPGEVMAIMGSSGAGKTTCLDILAGKSKHGTVGGDILINGKIPTREQFKRISGYVDQEESLMGTLTVYETLLYSALLRLPRTMSRQAKEKRVRDTMAELGIEHIANSRIGTAGKRGISGGEKRRVSIAMEVVTSPSILYLDEPTSGLDSYNALGVVQALVTLARKYQRTIILTIHQPRSNIFQMFDRLLLLAEGGYMIYSGPIVGVGLLSQSVPARQSTENTNVPGDQQQKAVTLNSTAQAPVPVLLDWLSYLGVSCPPGFNLADYVIDITKTGGFVDRPSLNGDSLVDSEKITMQSRESSRVQQRRKQLKSEGSSSSDETARSFSYSSQSPAAAVPIELIERLQTAEEHIPIAQRDLDEVEPHIRHLVLGFSRSFAGKLLKQSMEDSCWTGKAPGQGLFDQNSATAEQQFEEIKSPIGDEGDVENTPLLRGAANQLGQQKQLIPARRPDHQLLTLGASTAVASNTTANSNLLHYADGDSEQPSAVSLDARILAAIRKGIHTLFQLSIPRQTSRPTFWMQFRILSRRTFANFYRNPLLMWGHYGISIALALVCGSLFWQVTDDLSGFQSRLGIFFFLFAVFGFSSLSSLELFAKERTMFMRERANGFYGVAVYYLTKILFDMLPLRVIPPLLLGSVSYYMIGLYSPVVNFAKFLLVLVLFNLTASAVCLVIAAVCGANIAAANLIGVMTMLFNMLFGGFLINKVHIPGWLGWLQYLSFYNYAFEAVLVNELEEISLEDRKIGIPIQIPGPLILDTLGFKPGNYWPDVISLIWMFIAFLALGFIVLQVYVKERR